MVGRVAMVAARAVGAAAVVSKGKVAAARAMAAAAREWAVGAARRTHSGRNPDVLRLEPNWKRRLRGTRLE